MRKQDPENVLVQSLAYLTRTKSLYGGDLEAAVTTMRTVASRIQYRLQQSAREGASFHNKESHIRQILQNVLRLVDEQDVTRVIFSMNLISRLGGCSRIKIPPRKRRETKQQLSGCCSITLLFILHSNYQTLKINVILFRVLKQEIHEYFRSVSNILEPSNRQAWLDLSSDTRKKVATELLLGLDENAFLLAGVMNEPDVFLESSDILSKLQACKLCMCISCLSLPVQFLSWQWLSAFDFEPLAE